MCATLLLIVAPSRRLHLAGIFAGRCLRLMSLSHVSISVAPYWHRPSLLLSCPLIAGEEVHGPVGLLFLSVRAAEVMAGV